MAQPDLIRNALKPGQSVLWYEIEQTLGQGGFGITYVARDTNLQQQVAIKEYLPSELAVRENGLEVHPVSTAQTENFTWGLEKFMDEARTLAHFDHRNIVKVYTVFEANNTAYMVMRYEDGMNLGAIYTKRKRLRERLLQHLIHPILDGLEEVHAAGFIHRDIKPDNIYLRQDASPVLLDFGSARLTVGSETRAMTSLVSPGYAPFEQYVTGSDKQGPWSDIYSLGATLYRGIAGVAPQDAINRSEALSYTGKDVFVPAIEVGSDRYSEPFLRAVDAALGFRYDERPQSVAEWRAMFKARRRSRRRREVALPVVSEPEKVSREEFDAATGPDSEPDASPPAEVARDDPAPVADLPADTGQAPDPAPTADAVPPVDFHPAPRRAIPLWLLALLVLVAGMAAFAWFRYTPDVAPVHAPDAGADGPARTAAPVPADGTHAAVPAAATPNAPDQDPASGNAPVEPAVIRIAVTTPAAPAADDARTDPVEVSAAPPAPAAKATPTTPTAVPPTPANACADVATLPFIPAVPARDAARFAARRFLISGIRLLGPDDPVFTGTAPGIEHRLVQAARDAAGVKDTATTFVLAGAALQQLADTATAELRDAGMLASVIVPMQHIVDGGLQLLALQWRVGTATLTGAPATHRTVNHDIINRIMVPWRGRTMSSATLKKQLLAIISDPAFRGSAFATLRPGQRLMETTVELQWQNARANIDPAVHASKLYIYSVIGDGALLPVSQLRATDASLGYHDSAVAEYRRAVAERVAEAGGSVVPAACLADALEDAYRRNWRALAARNSAAENLARLRRREVR